MIAEDVKIVKSEDVIIPTVKELEKLILPADISSIQFTPLSLEVSNNFDSNLIGFVDHIGFKTKFSEETKRIANIDKLLAKGNEFVHMLYTFRSVSRAIPMTSNPQPGSQSTNEQNAEHNNKKNEFNRKLVEILRPEITKLKHLMDFTNELIALFVETVTQLAHPQSNVKVVPEGLYSSLIKIVDLILKLDNLKDMKACLNNDFSRYKRTIGLLSSQSGCSVSTTIMEEQLQLQQFLSNQDPRKAKQYIFLTLREEVKKVMNHEEILTDILEQTIDHMEKKLFITPDEKFGMIRVLPHFLILIDGNIEDPRSFNVFRMKKSSLLNQVQKIMKQYPLVPLYGDMPLTLYYILERSPHFDKNSMTTLWKDATYNDKKIPDNYNLATHWQNIRESYSTYISQFARLINRLNYIPFTKVHDPAYIDRSKEIYDIVKEGFCSLSEWSCMVKQMLTWKYIHPAPHPNAGKAHVKLDTAGIEYELVIRYNFSKAELSILMDIISMIKSCASLLAKEESRLAPIIRYHIHHEVQKIVQTDLLPLLHRANKRKKDELLSNMLEIRGLVADWDSEEEKLSGDYLNYTRKQGRLEGGHTARMVAPSPTQLHLLRTQIRALYDEKSIGRLKLGIFGKVDLEKEEIAILEKFYYSSYFYTYMLQYSSTLKDVSDLGDLWYREFYLELTRCVQFPIEMSLPWILTQHIIQTQTQAPYQVTQSHMIETILFALDIYNDAAHRALFVLNQQFLYDEIEAEANLVFDQFIYLIADSIYSNYKDYIAANSIEIHYRDKIEEVKRKQFLTIGKLRFDSVMEQKNVVLLGRTIDLNHLIGQQVNTMFTRDLELCLKSFESTEITALPELKTYLDILRQTHQLLSKHLFLDAFDSLFHEVNESLAPTAFRGRVVIHLLHSLITDIIPNYSYNMFTLRFVPSPIALRPWKANKSDNTKNSISGGICGRAYDILGKLTRGFFGRSHLNAFISICGKEDIPLIVQYCMEHLSHKLAEVQADYVALRDGIPPCKLPKFMFRTGGCYGYLVGKLQTVIDYEGLRTELFQSFREIGNIIALMQELSNVLDIQDVFQHNYCAPILLPTLSSGAGIVATSTKNFNVSLGESIFASTLKGLWDSTNSSTKSSYISLLPDLSDQITNTLTNESKSPSQTRQPLQKKSLLVHTLDHIRDILTTNGMKVDWQRTCERASNGAIEAEDPKEFHRFWSAVNFAFCVPPKAEKPKTTNATGGSGSMHTDTSSSLISDIDEFGHGVAIAGCALLHLMEQRSLFELLDFSYHVLNVKFYELNAILQSNQVGSVDAALQDTTNQFISSAAKQKTIHGELLTLFETLYPMHDVSQHVPSSRKIFSPPMVDQTLSSLLASTTTTSAATAATAATTSTATTTTPASGAALTTSSALQGSNVKDTSAAGATMTTPSAHKIPSRPPMSTHTTAAVPGPAVGPPPPPVVSVPITTPPPPIVQFTDVAPPAVHSPTALSVKSSFQAIHHPTTTACPPPPPSPRVVEAAHILPVAPSPSKADESSHPIPPHSLSNIIEGSEEGDGLDSSKDPSLQHHIRNKAPPIQMTRTNSKNIAATSRVKSMAGGILQLEGPLPPPPSEPPQADHVTKIPGESAPKHTRNASRTQNISFPGPTSAFVEPKEGGGNALDKKGAPRPPPPPQVTKDLETTNVVLPPPPPAKAPPPPPPPPSSMK